MSRIRATVLTAVTAATLTAASSTTQAATPDLTGALRQALAAPGIDLRRAAALAVDLETGKVVFRENSTLALMPASAEKLAVSFAALRLLGPGFRFRTEVVGSGSLDGRLQPSTEPKSLQSGPLAHAQRSTVLGSSARG